MKPWFEFRHLSRIALVAVVALSASTAFAQQPKRGGTLNLILTSEPTTLVTLTTVATTTLSVSAKVSEGLLKYDYDLSPQPQLATSWTISPDGKEYTFNLRQGVKWHDGQDFTSADVAFSILTLKKIHPRGVNTFANVEEVKTPDAHTAILVLSKPAPYLIKAFAAAESPVLPRHIYAGTDPLTNPNGNAPIGTGPYKFKEWVRGSHIIYERNPDYWDKPKPYIDRLVVKFFADPAARSLAFETGEADLGYRTPVALGDLDRFKKLPNVAFETKGNSYSFNVSSLQFNLDDKHFDNARVRQAIAHALDRKIAVQVGYYGYGVVSDSPIAPGLKAYHDPSPSPYAFDLKRANALLDEAGYARGADGFRFKATLDFNPISDDFKRLAEYTRSALSKIGIDVTLRAQDLSAFVKRVYTDRDFEFTINGHSNLFDPTVGVQRLYWSKNFFKGRPFSNASHYVNPEVDQLLEDAQTEIDPVKRAALFTRFQQRVAVDVPDINLVSPQFITIHNKRVHDHSLTADGVESNLADVYLE
ncbi:peptide ABC transporter substrate-binding protein [Betaproteobacteria bacterium]|nr:peptide ABC transporter substrate-binding protein [Betaproteobacteria bacterium]GHU24041.1 peptide ABC transporter substrate-binding protein [Betaproteobacteria bacterium]